MPNKLPPTADKNAPVNQSDSTSDSPIPDNQVAVGEVTNTEETLQTANWPALVVQTASSSTTTWASAIANKPKVSQTEPKKTWATIASQPKMPLAEALPKITRGSIASGALASTSKIVSSGSKSDTSKIYATKSSPSLDKASTSSHYSPPFAKPRDKRVTQLLDQLKRLQSTIPSKTDITEIPQAFQE